MCLLARGWSLALTSPDKTPRRPVMREKIFVSSQRKARACEQHQNQASFCRPNYLPVGTCLLACHLLPSQLTKRVYIWLLRVIMPRVVERPLLQESKTQVKSSWECKGSFAASAHACSCIGSSVHGDALLPASARSLCTWPVTCMHVHASLQARSGLPKKGHWASMIPF